MTRFPWHVWPILALGLVWHGIGAFDYTMTQIEWAPWMDLMTARQATFADRMPSWVDAVWATTVWFGLLGVLLLAGGIAVAPLVLFVSALAVIILTLWFQFVSTPNLLALGGTAGVVTLVFACAFGILLWLYARWLRAKSII